MENLILLSNVTCMYHLTELLAFKVRVASKGPPKGERVGFQI